LIPKEEKFFELFEHAANNVEKGILLLKALVTDYAQLQRYAREVKEAEHAGDTITHDIILKLNKTFVTPLDRDDIHELACRLDDIMDMGWGVADRFVLYEIQEPTVQMIEIIDLLVRAVVEIRKAISKINKLRFDHILEHCIAVDGLENQVDQIVRHAVATLMNRPSDHPLQVLKLKEIYDHLERAADKCADVANVLESVTLKQT
jgi:predicted phosphate transport protein (TIGR00153 family)